MGLLCAHPGLSFPWAGGVEDGFQKTKSASWPQGAAEGVKINCIMVVFDFVHAVYHRRFRTLSNYDSAYSMRLASCSDPRDSVLLQAWLGRLGLGFKRSSDLHHTRPTNEQIQAAVRAWEARTHPD